MTQVQKYALFSHHRMEKARKISVGVLLFTTSVAICLAQHWSYGLQPGGKRNVENLVESFQEIANEMENLGEAQKAECPGSYQHPSLSNLKETMASLIEGEARRKKI
ncbi:progonadoliberin-1 isoform X1 [Meleagris gallopavo]|nr:progonadoliberin-1 isoform X1 [Meleagris gallopavo]